MSSFRRFIRGGIHAVLISLSGITGAEELRLHLADLGQWRCPPSQDCARKPDYLAYVSNTPQANVYISFSGELAWPPDEAMLRRTFRFIDVYLPQARTDEWHALKVSADDPELGSATFLLPSSQVLVVELRTRGYRVRRVSRGRDVMCPGSDIRGECILEEWVADPSVVQLRLPLPASSRAPWLR